MKNYNAWIDLNNASYSFRDYKYFIGLTYKTAYILCMFGNRKSLMCVAFPSQSSKIRLSTKIVKQWFSKWCPRPTAVVLPENFRKCKFSGTT